MIGEIRPITDRETWDAFLTEASPRTFLHAWAWGAFQERLGAKIRRLGAYADGRLVAVALIISVRAKRGNFLLCPHGPIFESKSDSLGILQAFTTYLEGVGREEGAAFIRFAPILFDTPEHRDLFRRLGYRPAPMHVHPELSWLLDIRQSEEGLLKAMRKTTRYSIRKAINDSVSVSVGSSAADLEAFWEVYGKTVQRQHFTPFSESYLLSEIEIFSEDSGAGVVIGSVQGEPVSSAIIIFNGRAAYYHHGASTQAYPKIPASHAVLWEAIREAKRRGCEIFNFWGIAPGNRPRHPWAGLTLFKKGFGGYAESYVPAQDKALRWSYWTNWVIERFRKMQRGL